MVKEINTHDESRKRQLEYQHNNAGDPKRYNGHDPLLKLLVPSYAVGALIGKGGALLNEIKTSYGGNIRISGSRDYYPGTDERVVVITGEIDQIIDINNHVMEKVQDPGREPTMKNITIDKDRAQKVKIVLTNGAAGLLIGRNGATIKAIQEESKAKISICGIEVASVPGERVLTMHGSTDERTEACKQIIGKIAQDSSNMANTKIRYTVEHIGYADNVVYNSVGLQTVKKMGDLSLQGSSKNKLKAKVEVQIEVPNVLVGGILGTQGSIIKELVHRSGGAGFKFSEKIDDDDVRTLTITGDMDQAGCAYAIVNERVAQLTSVMHRGIN